jgi:hypothetical protein
MYEYEDLDTEGMPLWASGTIEISLFFIDGIRSARQSNAGFQHNQNQSDSDSNDRPTNSSTAGDRRPPADDIDRDPVRVKLASSGVAWLYYLTQDLGVCAKAVRAANLDILIYPEIGIDPVGYFLSYARLAPVQAAWFVHPDTTGIKSIDYYLSSDVEVPRADMFYSETLIRFRGLGAVFTDAYSNNNTGKTQLQQQSPRTALLERAKFIELLRVPRAAHIYVIPHPLYKLHGTFDEVISKLLLQDKLGYIIILDFHADRQTWQSLFINRCAGRYSLEVLP